MTREEAIKELRRLYYAYRADEHGDYFYDNADDVCQAASVAISALREHEERSKGCEYCTDSKSIYEIKSKLHDSYNTDVYISETALVVDIGCHSFGTAGVKFCPMCGRRLEEV